MYGAGAAVPAGLVGAGLISHAGKESRKSIEDARNKALQAALGIAAMGGGLYALHRTMGGPQQDQQASSHQLRHAAAKPEVPQLVEKLATVAFLDTLFEHQATNGPDKSTQQKAAECRLLNAEHGADLLRQLLD
jgi:hypothetical protein